MLDGLRILAASQRTIVVMRIFAAGPCRYIYEKFSSFEQILANGPDGTERDSLCQRLTSQIHQRKDLMNRIRFVPTAVHGVLDYVGAIGLIASPFIFGFAGMGGTPVILPIVLGVGLIAYSLATDYERGIPALRVIPMRVHLAFDFVASAFLAAAPFLFGYSVDGLNVWLPQVAAGLSVILLVLVSKTEPTQTIRAKLVEAHA